MRNRIIFYTPSFAGEPATCHITLLYKKTKNNFCCSSFAAEREGFEPPVPLSTSVFKTGAIDHSATFPIFLSATSVGHSDFDVAKV